MVLHKWSPQNPQELSLILSLDEHRLSDVDEDTYRLHELLFLNVTRVQHDMASSVATHVFQLLRGFAKGTLLFCLLTEVRVRRFEDEIIDDEGGCSWGHHERLYYTFVMLGCAPDSST